MDEPEFRWTNPSFHGRKTSVKALGHLHGMVTLFFRRPKLAPAPFDPSRWLRWRGNHVVGIDPPDRQWPLFP
jgi:hypothetical protein